MSDDTRSICSHTTRNGSPCRAAALAGKDCCTFHDPELAARRAAGRRAGGRARSRPRAVLSKAPDIQFTSVGDVIDLLAATASQVRRGEIDVKIGNLLTYIAGTATNAVLKGDMEKRLAAMERALAAIEKKEKS